MGLSRRGLPSQEFYLFQLTRMNTLKAVKILGWGHTLLTTIHFTNLNTLRIPAKPCTLGTDSSIVNGIQMPSFGYQADRSSSTRYPWFVYPRTNSRPVPGTHGSYPRTNSRAVPVVCRRVQVGTAVPVVRTGGSLGTGRYLRAVFSVPAFLYRIV